MKTLFATGHKSAQQTLYRWSVAAGGWVEDEPLSTEERAEMEKQWPTMEGPDVTEEQAEVWFDERFVKETQ